MSFSLFLALKYLKPKRSFISVITVISILGVLLAVAILVIVLSVMTGFDDVWREKILGFNPHLTVSRSPEIIENDEAIAARLERIEGISDATPHVQTIVLMRSGDKVAAPFVVGMPLARKGLMKQIADKIEYGSFDISYNNIIIGMDLARQLHVTVGDTVLVYSPKCVMTEDEIHLPEELLISGIFKLGMWEFDSRYALTSLDMARELYGIEAGAMAIRVTTENPLHAAEFAGKVTECLDRRFQVLTWMDLNKVLFDALRVEKSTLFMLLAFISIVAIFCIMNTLIVIGVQKTNEIGLLKALGFSAPKIMGVFIWYGWIQCIIGTMCGIGTALLALHYRNDLLKWLSSRLGVKLLPPSIYQLSEIPSHTTFSDIALICAVTIVFCTIASILPAARAAALDPAEALRHE